MVHIGILCPTVSGHLNPMIALGYELKSRGHRVTIVGILDGQAKVLTAGLESLSIGTAEFPLGSSAQSFNKLGQLSGIPAIRYTFDLVKQAAAIVFKECPSALKEMGVDLLLIDQFSWGSSTVAEHLDIPFITVCCALMLNQDPNAPPTNTTWSYHSTPWARWRNQVGHQLMNSITRPLSVFINEYRQQWGLAPLNHPNEAYSHLAQLSQHPPEFEFPRQSLPACFHFTGPYSNPATREPTNFPFEQLTEKPLIYASLGTLQNQMCEIFQVIAEACQDLEVQLVIALGGGMNPESFPHLAGSPIVVGYAPQLDLLKRTTLTITHAGLNTALESLSHGVPMVAIPITNEQPGVASRIKWTGTGEFVSLKRLSVPRLQRMIEQVLMHDSYRDNAVRLQKAIQVAGGTSRAAEIIEQVIATGKPVLRHRIVASSENGFVAQS